MTSTSRDPLARNLRREQAIEDALRNLIREYLQDEYPQLNQAGIDLPIHLKVLFRAGESGDLRFEPDLRKQVIAQADGLVQPLESYQPGAVYDYSKDSTDVHGCRPPTARSVFEGYDQKGQPTWTSFDEWRETGLGDGEITVRLQSGVELRDRQLESYGKHSKHYHILGQACLGYLPATYSFEPLIEDDRLALTVQVVEIRDARNQFDLVLNVLAGRLMPEELDALLAEPGCQHVLRALRRLEEDIFRVRDRAMQAWHERNDAAFRQILQRVPGALTRFDRNLTVDGIPTRELRQYPIVDIQVATIRDMFFDRERDSWVLLGSNEMAYVFDGNGDLLTSFHAPESRVRLRLQSGRWRQADGDEQPILDLLKVRVRDLLDAAPSQTSLT